MPKRPNKSPWDAYQAGHDEYMADMRRRAEELKAKITIDPRGIARDARGEVVGYDSTKGERS